MFQNVNFRVFYETGKDTCNSCQSPEPWERLGGIHADQAIPFYHDFLQTKFNNKNKNNWNFSGFYPLFQVELEFGNVGF